MKSKNLKELFQKRAVKAGSLALVVMIAAGSLWSVNQQSTAVPELVTFVDTEENVVIEEDEVPLAAPKVTKSTKTTKKTKKIKMKKASKKTYTKAGKKTKKTKTQKSSTQKTNTTTKTETQTQITNKYKKGSKINTQVTTVKTTVTKTVIVKQSAAAVVPVVQEESIVQDPVSGIVSLNTAAPKLNSSVAQAFENLHFTIEVDASVPYSGKFSARSQNVILKRMNDTVYHELGHFVAFAAGNIDLTAEWKNVYSNEKSLYTGSNRAYVLSTVSEYFAESFKEYTLNPAALKSARPQTYAVIEASVAKITDAQVNAIWNIYKSIWK